MKKLGSKTISLILGCALLGGASTVSAQNVLSDVFSGNGFTNSLTGPYIGSMTLSYTGSALAPYTTNNLTDLPNYQLNASITATNGITYNFDNISLANGSTNLAAVQLIVLPSGGFVFYNTNSTPSNSHGGSADFLNSDGSFLTTAPPGYLSGYPDAITNGYSFYVLANSSGTLAQGDYGSGPVIAPVPEPTTLALVSIGGLGLLLLRRRNFLARLTRQH